MPFKKGQSGNPGGSSKSRRQWMKEKERIREARATMERLKRVRDDLVLERKQVGTDDAGKPIMVDVVLSARDYLACCKEILNRCVGLPRQELELSGRDGETLRIVMGVVEEKEKGDGPEAEFREDGFTVHFDS